MTSTTPSIALHSSVAALFANLNDDSANKLAGLINEEIGSEGFKKSTEPLDALLTSISNQVLLSSLAHRETIDDYVNFVSFTSLLINNEAVHVGTIRKEGEQSLYKVAPLHPASGPAILGENLAKALFDALWGATSRAFTPDEGYDREQDKQYYYKCSVHASILARSFVLAPSFQESLWRVIEDILIKGLFSQGEQEPGVFIALTAILLGSGKEIEEYLGGQERGKGKEWLWYDDVRTEPDAKWGWKDVVEALKKQPGQWAVDRLPKYVIDNVELAKKHVGDGAVGDSWDSGRLASEAFKWASVDQ